MHQTIKWTPSNFEQFKSFYDLAVKEGYLSFRFKNKRYLTIYAKYLIE